MILKIIKFVKIKLGIYNPVLLYLKMRKNKDSKHKVEALRYLVIIIPPDLDHNKKTQMLHIFSNSQQLLLIHFRNSYHHILDLWGFLLEQKTKTAKLKLMFPFLLASGSYLNTFQNNK